MAVRHTEPVEKLVYVLWGDGGPAEGDELRRRLLEESAPLLLAAGAKGLTVNVHDSEASTAPSPVPAPEGEAPHCAEVSLWIDSYDRRQPFEKVIVGVGLRCAGYLVVESLYEDYGTTPHGPPRSWPDGRRSPGVLTVALIHRPEGLAYREWIERWHGTQSPLSAELQPRTRYVRNEVVRALTDGGPEVHGIVEEAWPSTGHVADPMLFYNAGTREELNTNITRMLDSVNACLDLSRIRSSTMSEYLVKTL
jgi:hypothetical protein